MEMGGGWNTDNAYRSLHHPAGWDAICSSETHHNTQYSPFCGTFEPAGGWAELRRLLISLPALTLHSYRAWIPAPLAFGVRINLSSSSRTSLI